MGSMANSSLQPTWYGHVSSARDALILFEACLSGVLSHVPRRPHDRERSQLIRSGYVFIYEENASGIKRWTDGMAWSPSRILGNFLLYRELVKPFPPGEKKRAMKKSERPSNGTDGYDAPSSPIGSDITNPDTELERALIGSLVDSYGFKEEGLVKKTMSVNLNGVHHHLVSYYLLDEVKDNRLGTPSTDPRLANVEPRPDLVARQNFRASADDPEEPPFRDLRRDHFRVQQRMETMGQRVYDFGPSMYPRQHVTIGGPPNQEQNHHGVTHPNYIGTTSHRPRVISPPGMQHAMYNQAEVDPQQGDYQPNHAMASTDAPDHYIGYGHGFQNTHESLPAVPAVPVVPAAPQERRSSQQHHQANAFPFRQNSMSSLPNTTLDANLHPGDPNAQHPRPLDTSWTGNASNSNSGVYSRPPTGPPQQSSPSWSNHGQWNSLGPNPPNLPRPDPSWGASDAGGWNTPSDSSSRQNGYHTAP